jgi:hypothetical protein
MHCVDILRLVVALVGRIAIASHRTSCTWNLALLGMALLLELRLELGLELRLDLRLGLHHSSV